MDIAEKFEEMQEEIAMRPRKPLTPKKILTIVTLAIVCVIVLMIALFCINYKKMQTTIAEQEARITELLEQPAVVEEVTPEISLSMIYEEIGTIGELATVKYLFTDAARFTDKQEIWDWEIPWTEKSFTLKWDGVIKAGIQVDAIVIAVDEENKIITVTMPAAEILSYEIDNDSVEMLDEKNNIFNKISVEDKVSFDATMEEEMKERAIKNGLLETAQANAEDIVYRLLTANEAINGEYTIVFEIAE